MVANEGNRESDRYIVQRHLEGGYAIVPAPENAARSWGSVREAYEYAQAVAGWHGERVGRPAGEHARRFQDGGR